MTIKSFTYQNLSHLKINITNI